MIDGTPRRVLIVTPTLGLSRYLPETVDSVARFSPHVTHVLISPQGRVSELTNNYPGLRVIAEPPGVSGIYGALNHAIEVLGADYEWFSWINDDDLLEPGFAEIVARSAQTADVDILYGDVLFIGPHGERICYAPRARSAWVVRQCAKIGQIPFTQQGGLIRTQRFQGLGGFDTTYTLGADTEFFFRAILARARTMHVGQRTALYRMLAGQLSSDSGKQNAEHEKMIEAHCDLRNSMARRFIRAAFLIENSGFLIQRVRRFGLLSIRQIMDRMGSP